MSLINELGIGVGVITTVGVAVNTTVGTGHQPPVGLGQPMPPRKSHQKGLEVQVGVGESIVGVGASVTVGVISPPGQSLQFSEGDLEQYARLVNIQMYGSPFDTQVEQSSVAGGIDEVGCNIIVGIGVGSPGQGANSQFGPVLPTYDPSGHSFTSCVQTVPPIRHQPPAGSLQAKLKKLKKLLHSSGFGIQVEPVGIDHWASRSNSVNVGVGIGHQLWASRSNSARCLMSCWRESNVRVRGIANAIIAMNNIRRVLR